MGRGGVSPKIIIICLVRPRIAFTQVFLTLEQPLLLEFKTDKNRGYYFIIIFTLFSAIIIPTRPGLASALGLAKLEYGQIVRVSVEEEQSSVLMCNM